MEPCVMPIFPTSCFPVSTLFVVIPALSAFSALVLVATFFSITAIILVHLEKMSWSQDIALSNLVIFEY